MRVTKHQRQHRITKLLESKAVGSQSHLVDLLAADGIDATQTTVSRDLEELGAVKVRLPGGDTAVMMDSLARVCLTLPDETHVLPGHGPATTIGVERASNQFLAGLNPGPGVNPGTGPGRPGRSTGL